jgi:DNA-binding NtrC family response regulator/predicted ATPase
LTITRDQRTMAGAMAFLQELVGESAAIAAIRERIGQLLARAANVRRLPPVLVQGETGTGKGLVARALHRAGPRAPGPFVDVNCAAIPETLLEAEMFGFERGAFTDARQAKRGLFQTAHRGTLFLDEVGLLPEAIQAKLLTVLEERTVRRLGATQPEPVDVWIIAATNTDLQAATRAGRFREDLYHRLAVLTLDLPPLRERGRDVLVLARHLLARACDDYGLPAKALGADAEAALLAYRWPGNVRELANTMERAALLSDAPVVTPEMLGLPEAPAAGPAAAPAAVPQVPGTLAAAVEQAERARLLEALEATGWNVTRAAARLDISRNTLRYRIEKHGLRPGGPAPPRRQVRGAALASAPPLAPAAAPEEVPAPAAIRWERRRLTLLRAVVAARPGEVLVQTSRAVELFVDKVRAFGGRVENLSPAGLLGVFGLDPLEDAPRRAALAAIAIRTALPRSGTGGARAAARLGIHVGHFMIGRLGEASMVDQEALREALAVLDALVADAPEDAIRVSATAGPLLARRFGLVPEPGGAAAAPGYRLAGIEPGDGAAGRPARFVGRARDLEFLRGRLDAAVRGHGQAVAVVGDAGIGKSRLLAEFRERVAEAPLLYLEAQCLTYGVSTPYHVVLALCRALFRLVETDDPEAARAKVLATLGSLDMASERTQPYLLRLLGLGEGTEPPGPTSPGAVRARTFEALRELLVRLSGRDPLVLVVEDLHWIDRTSEEFLAFVVEAISGARVLLVTTHRPGPRPPWLDRSWATQLALEPLGREDSRSVVLDVLGGDALPEALEAAILAKAEGNPFFLEELARAVRDRRDPSPRLPMPDSIEAVLLARIDRLAPDDKAVLQSVAVIGRGAPLGLLQAVAGRPDEPLRGALTRLQAAEFLRENRLGPEPEYTFRHALVQEAAYESLLLPRRQALHARIVEVLEERVPDTARSNPELLARHCAGAGQLDRAVVYHHEAGRRASERSASVEAIAHLTAGLELLAALADTAERRQRELGLLIALGPVLINARGPLSLEVVRNYARALELCEVLPESPLHFAALWGSWRIAPDFHTKLERGHQLLALAERLADPALRLQAHHCLWASLFHLGQHRACCEHVEEGLRLYAVGDYRAHSTVYGGHDPKVCAIGERAFARWLLGSPDGAVTDSLDAVAWARRLGHAGSLVHALHMALLLQRFRRDPETAEPQARELVACAEEQGFPVHRAAGLVFSGWIAAARGRPEQGVALMRQGLEILDAVATREDVPVLLEMLAEAHADAGRLQEALDVLDRALAETDANGLAYWTAEVHRRRGEVLARLSPAREEEARACFERALTIARRQGARALELRAATSLARWRLGHADSRGACEPLAAAVHAFPAHLDSPDLRDARALLEAAMRAAGGVPTAAGDPAGGGP